VPLIPYRRTSDGRQRATGALADLLRSPAPATTQASLIAQVMTHLQLYGNAWVGKFRAVDGSIEQLACLHPERVTVELRGGRPIYTVTDAQGRRSEHGVDDVLHVRAPLSIDGLVGLSPIRQCRVALGLAWNLAEHAATFFENGGRPSGILKGPAGSQEQIERISQKWNERHAGTRNAHRIAVISGDLEFVQLTGPLDDMQFVENRRLSTAEIARLFRIPPWMLGASSGDSLTYSNTEQQGLAFVTYSLRPWLVCIEQAITADADLCRGPNVYVEFLLDALLRADSKTRAEVYAMALDPERGWMNTAEVRRLENLEGER
jgi:HK97 family phage portal protein